MHTSLSLATLLASLSRALDLTEGQPLGHSVRACLIGLRISEALGLPEFDRDELHLTLLLKDAGCSSNAARMFAIFGGDEVKAKRDAKICDWCRPLEAIKYGVGHSAPDAPLAARFQKVCELARFPGRVMDALTASRCQQGAQIARTLQLSERVAQGIYSLDEHWDGHGAPHGLEGERIPLFSRIACLAQTLEVFAATYGVSEAYSVIRQRSGRWFDPNLVWAATFFEKDTAFWEGLDREAERILESVTGGALAKPLPDSRIDDVCEAFAQVVDAKSPFTAQHSRRVAGYAVDIARTLGLGRDSETALYRAGLLHDLGKLGVPSQVLEKPGKLDPHEWEQIRRHPEGTARVLKGVPSLARITEIAVAHHEKLDGSGYYLGMDGSQLDIEMRVLAVADVFDALSAERPYRGALSLEEVAAILKKDEGTKLDADCIAAALTPQRVLQLAA